jgi:hypothetical protein
MPRNIATTLPAHDFVRHVRARFVHSHMKKLACLALLLGACDATTPDDDGVTDIPADAAPTDETSGTCASLHYTCGTIETDGTQVECGQCAPGVNCLDHVCPVEADFFEVNNAAAAATMLPFPASGGGLRGLTIDTRGDEDWYRFAFADATSLTDPTITVRLVGEAQDRWLFVPYEITAWFRCNTSDAGTEVAIGDLDGAAYPTPLTDPSLGKGGTEFSTKAPFVRFVPSCVTTDESGVVTIRVRGTGDAPRGDTYGLDVTVD